LPDVLTISFSTTDLVGHAFGPDSPELMDIFLNLNKSVSRLMKELDSKFKRDEVLYIVSADHGVQSAPEVLARAGRTGGRFNPSESVKSLEAQLVKIWGQGPWINAIVTGEIHFNEAVFNRNKKKFSEAVELLNKAPKIMGIHKFILLDPKLTEGQKTLSLYHKGLYPERSGQVLIQFNEGWTLDPWNVASHGTAHPDDVRIPLIFSGWRVRSGVRLKTAASADDAVPTVLSGLGLKLPKNVTGQSHAQDVFIP
jgi:arylsulfatase A-like enzyme